MLTITNLSNVLLKKIKKFSNIKHVFFSRKEGFSKGIYKGLNCGRGQKITESIY